MEYLLKLVRKSAERTFRLNTAADGEYEGGKLCLSYLSDGAECRLTVTKDKIVNEVKGEINTCAEFIENTETLYKFGDGRDSGALALFTKKLKIKLGAFGMSARCVYSYMDGGETELTVTAFPAGSK